MKINAKLTSLIATLIATMPRMWAASRILGHGIRGRLMAIGTSMPTMWNRGWRHEYENGKR